jgi:hypothetical protein
MNFRRGDVLNFEDHIYVIVSEIAKNGSFTTVSENKNPKSDDGTEISYNPGPIYCGMSKPYHAGIRVIGNISDTLPEKFESNKLNLRQVLYNAKEELPMIS